MKTIVLAVLSAVLAGCSTTATVSVVIPKPPVTYSSPAVPSTVGTNAPCR